MKYRPLGRTGVQVSNLCLGTMMFGAWGNTDHDDSIRIIHRALDAGVNFIGTADVYSAGESEEIVGKAIGTPPSRRDDVVLATKFFMPMGEDPNRRGGDHRPADDAAARQPAARRGHRPRCRDAGRIDAIVQPGVNLNPADTSYGEQVLHPALRRR
jgi:aryl-alcohol dehydrogenase-like predicted oxidoreductase